MQRIKFSFSRTENLKFLSHLEIMRTFHRALRRSRLPVAVSQGFNPQLRLSIALPLPVGVTAENEKAEIILEEATPSASFEEVLNKQLPEGLMIFNTEIINLDEPPLMKLVDAALYHVFKISGSEIPEGFLSCGVEEVSSKEKIIITRKNKKGIKETDIRPLIISLETTAETGSATLKMFLRTGSRGGVKPIEVLHSIGESAVFKDITYLMQIHRLALYHSNNENWEQL